MMDKLEGNYYDDLRHLAELIQAVLEGKVVQVYVSTTGWSDYECPRFVLKDLSRYRIKPLPVERWVVVDVMNNVLWSGSLEYLATNWSKTCKLVNRVVKLTEVT